MAPDYQRLGRGGDLTGMALKYQCAKALTIISMAAIVILAFASMFHTGRQSRIVGILVFYIQNRGC
jgi:hypothetical protein